MNSLFTCMYRETNHGLKPRFGRVWTIVRNECSRPPIFFYIVASDSQKYLTSASSRRYCCCEDHPIHHSWDPDRVSLDEYIAFEILEA